MIDFYLISCKIPRCCALLKLQMQYLRTFFCFPVKKKELNYYPLIQVCLHVNSI